VPLQPRFLSAALLFVCLAPPPLFCFAGLPLPLAFLGPPPLGL
jgi:hypothetical protein